jgi:hypothetical protein
MWWWNNIIRNDEFWEQELQFAKLKIVANIRARGYYWA